jgi:hypothetical protein
LQLLNDEICKERNCILQACRFIVENNFFEDKYKGKTMDSETETPADKEESAPAPASP